MTSTLTTSQQFDKLLTKWQESDFSAFPGAQS